MISPMDHVSETNRKRDADGTLCARYNCLTLIKNMSSRTITAAHGRVAAQEAATTFWAMSQAECRSLIILDNWTSSFKGIRKVGLNL